MAPGRILPPPVEEVDDAIANAWMQFISNRNAVASIVRL